MFQKYSKHAAHLDMHPSKKLYNQQKDFNIKVISTKDEKHLRKFQVYYNSNTKTIINLKSTWRVQTSTNAARPPTLQFCDIKQTFYKTYLLAAGLVIH